MNASTQEKTLLQKGLLLFSEEQRRLRESVDVSIGFSHHIRIPTLKLAANKKVGKVDIMFYVDSETDSETLKFEIQQYRYNDKIEKNPKITSIGRTSFSISSGLNSSELPAAIQASGLFNAIKTHLDFLNLDIRKVLFYADGNLGKKGEDGISEIFEILVEMFNPLPSHLMPFSNTPGCISAFASEEKYAEAHVVESKNLVPRINQLFGTLPKADKAKALEKAKSAAEEVLLPATKPSVVTESFSVKLQDSAQAEGAAAIPARSRRIEAPTQLLFPALLDRVSPTGSSQTPTTLPLSSFDTTSLPASPGMSFDVSPPITPGASYDTSLSRFSLFSDSAYLPLPDLKEVITELEKPESNNNTPLDTLPKLT
ncbi:MAG: hypothetical protein QNK11_09895 [Legionella sp.]|nr:hypothetical protein [Legionella sp.]